MTIQEQINKDLKDAILTKDEIKKSILRVIIGEFNRVDKIVDDVKSTSILKKMLENATNPNSLNLNEAKVLEQYVPKQLTKDQLSMLISQIVTDGNYTNKDLGKVMGELKKDFPGQYDGKIASELFKHLWELK